MILKKVWCVIVLIAVAFTAWSVGEICPVPQIRKFMGKVERGEPVTVVYFGGSITCGASVWPLRGTDPVIGEQFDYTGYNQEYDGWRALSFEWLRSRLEKKPGQFKQVNAAIGGTPSLMGTYRLEQDVLSQHPDLVFVEFAVNDNGKSKLTRENPMAPNSILRTDSSIVGRLRAQNPDVVVIMPLSTHRVLKGSSRSISDPALDGGLEQTLRAAEMLRIPYVNIKEAFYSDPSNPDTGKYYGGDDNPGNYVHPAPEGHRAYALAVEGLLSNLFEKAEFSFKQKVDPVPPYPVRPQLVLPETLATHATGWQIEMPAGQLESPVLEGHPCLATGPVNSPLEYTFRGSAIGLWCDLQSSGGMDIYLDGQKLGQYVMGVKQTAAFSGRFCTLRDSMDSSLSHTLRLVPIALPDAEHPRIFLRALTLDAN